jgi:hypothetical protein
MRKANNAAFCVRGVGSVFWYPIGAALFEFHGAPNGFVFQFDLY